MADSDSKCKPIKGNYDALIESNKKTSKASEQLEYGREVKEDIA